MNVLFVSDSQNTRAPYLDGSTRYRCYHMAEGLHLAGVLADVTTLASLNIANLSRYDVVSIHQPTASRKLLNVLERCKKLNIRTVADVDALEFDPARAKYSAHSRAKNSSVESVRLDFMRQNLALRHFDEISAATEELARIRRSLAPQQHIYVVQNGLSEYWLNCNDHLNSTSTQRQRIGYFPDSSGNSINFAQAAKPLSSYLKNSPNSELYAAGPLVFPGNQIPKAQLLRGTCVDYINMPTALSGCWVTIAPHQHNCIDYAQPHTKFIEAAAFGVPIISSPSDDLLRHDVTGLMIAKTSDQWLQSLDALSDRDYREQCRKTLYDYVRSCCLARHSAQILIGQWSAEREQPNNETATPLSAAS